MNEHQDLIKYLSEGNKFLLNYMITERQLKISQEFFDWCEGERAGGFVGQIKIFKINEQFFVDCGGGEECVNSF